MKANPSVTPAMWGTVRRKPWASPDDISMMLLGPGVKNTTKDESERQPLRHEQGLTHDGAGSRGYGEPRTVRIQRSKPAMTPRQNSAVAGLVNPPCSSTSLSTPPM